MADFKPSYPFSTPIELLIPVYTQTSYGTSKVYPENGIRLNCSFKTYGWTEENTKYEFAVINTAVVETWFRPDIDSDCRIKLLSTGAIYEVIGKPENISERNQFCKFKVRAIGHVLSVSLIAETAQTDAIRQQIMQETKRTVSGTMLEIQQDEYDRAQQYRLMPTYRIKLFIGEYNGEKLAEVLGRRYHIYRVHGTCDYIELFLGERISDIGQE